MGSKIFYSHLFLHALDLVSLEMFEFNYQHSGERSVHQMHSVSRRADISKPLSFATSSCLWPQPCHAFQSGTTSSSEAPLSTAQYESFCASSFRETQSSCHLLWAEKGLPKHRCLPEPFHTKVPSHPICILTLMDVCAMETIPMLLIS